MGPRPFSRGNGLQGIAGREVGPHFNGATAFQPWKHAVLMVNAPPLCLLQWGHGLSAVETFIKLYPDWTCMTDFNGATAFQPWKPAGNCWKRPPHNDFNGATAFQPWKLCGCAAVRIP